MDQSWWGIDASLKVFGPLLRPKSKNKHATILGTNMEAIHYACEQETLPTPKEKVKILMGYVRHKAVLRTVKTMNRTDADFIQSKDLMFAFSDFEDHFQQYMVKEKYREASKQAGLRLVTENTFGEKWPLDLPENATDEQLVVFLAACYGGRFRFLEWKRE